RSTMPVAAVQRNASRPVAEEPSPTSVDPSADTPSALLLKRPPGRSPRPTIPVAAVHRDASPPPGKRPLPTTTKPSAATETGGGKSRKLVPGRTPRPRNIASAPAVAPSPAHSTVAPTNRRIATRIVVPLHVRPPATRGDALDDREVFDILCTGAGRMTT